jgi:isopenicillin N synthase-like dioxygenase
MPFFFDPGFDARVAPIEGTPRSVGAPERWDGADVHAFAGTYGEYLLAKVSRVFPDLRRDVL